MAQARWQRKDVARIRTEVRTELDAFGRTSGDDLRIRHALKKVAELQDDLSSFGILRCYAFICAALIQHTRTGGLSDVEVRRLGELAENLLRLKGIPAFNSPLSILYAEVHSILGQIYKSKNGHRQAAWSAHLAEYHGKQLEKKPVEFALALGIRSLRIGQAELAAEYYDEGLKRGPTNKAQYQALILGQIKAPRLAHQYDALQNAIGSADPSRFTEKGIMEFRWEEAAVVVQSTGDLQGLLPFIKNTDGDSVSYRLEACLWLRAYGRVTPERFMVKPAYLKRKFGAEIKTYLTFYRACEHIEQCYDAVIPFERRLRTLIDLDDVAVSQMSVDKELLYLAAMTQWLFRYGPRPMMQAVADRYRRISLQMTSSRSEDCLQVFGNIRDSK